MSISFIFIRSSFYYLYFQANVFKNCIILLFVIRRIMFKDDSTIQNTILRKCQWSQTRTILKSKTCFSNCLQDSFQLSVLFFCIIVCAVMWLIVYVHSWPFLRCVGSFETVWLEQLQLEESFSLLFELNFGRGRGLDLAGSALHLFNARRFLGWHF